MATLDPHGFRIELPCPHCEQTDLQLIGDLIGKREIACRYCRATINLTNKKLQAGLNEMIEGLREIIVLKH
jgi:hypothetical protein